MASVVPPRGKVTDLRPKDGRAFTLDELYQVVGSPVQPVYLHDGTVMFCHELAKLIKPRPPVNMRASLLLAMSGGIPGDRVLGTVLITTRKEAGEE